MSHFRQSSTSVFECILELRTRHTPTIRIAQCSLSHRDHCILKVFDVYWSTHHHHSVLEAILEPGAVWEFYMHLPADVGVTPLRHESD